jgi:integrase
MATFIEVTAALSARRGEVLALRWSDIVGGRAIHRAVAIANEGGAGV